MKQENAVNVSVIPKVSKRAYNEARELLKGLSSFNDPLSGVRRQVSRNTNYATQLQKISEPLGRITGQADEFTKSLEASNARVIAFGASAGVIAGVAAAFKSVFDSTVLVQKSLKELQVISGASTDQMSQYSNALFDIAKNTATSFQDATKAALEFSRQGLSMNEILKRTNDTMIMTRITGIDLNEAINGLTATINAFSNEDLSSSEILNTLSAIDLAAAASTDGMIKGMARSASAARTAGVSFRELAAVIATLQEKTGLQGGTLGNAAKSIFTRIIDPQKLKTLSNYNIKFKADNGELIQTMDILRNIAKTIKQTEGGLAAFGDKSELVSFLKEMSGLYQIDKLTALVNDLGKSIGELELSNEGRETLQRLQELGGIEIRTNTGDLKNGVDILNELSSVIEKTSDDAQKSKLNDLYTKVSSSVSSYDRNLANANSGTDEAYQKNELLNQTLDAQIQKLKTVIVEMGSAFGNVSLVDSLTESLKSFNTILEKVTEGIRGEGSLSFLSGVAGALTSIFTRPGLVLAVATIAKQIGTVAGFAKDSWLAFMGLNKSAQEQLVKKQQLAGIESQIASMMSQESRIAAILNSEGLSRELQAERVSEIYKEQLATMSRIAKVASEVAPIVQKEIGHLITPNKTVKNKSRGTVDAISQEISDIRAGIGGARGGDKPILLENFNFEGKKQDIVANSGEYVVKSNKGGYSILTRNQARQQFGERGFARGSRGPATARTPLNSPESTAQLLQIIKGATVSISEFSTSLEKGATRINSTINDFQNKPINSSDLLERSKPSGPMQVEYKNKIIPQNEAAKEDINKKLEDSSKKANASLEDTSLKLIKWSFVMSGLSGAIGGLTKDSGEATKMMVRLSESLQKIILVNMAMGAIGSRISLGPLRTAGKKVAESGIGQKIGGFLGGSGGAVSLLGKFSSALKIAGTFLKGFLGPIGAVWAAFEVASAIWPKEINAFSTRVGEALNLIDTPAEKAAKAIDNLAESAAKSAFEAGGYKQEDISNIMKEAISAQTRLLSTDRDKMEKYKTDKEFQEGTFNELIKERSGRGLGAEQILSSDVYLKEGVKYTREEFRKLAEEEKKSNTYLGKSMEDFLKKRAEYVKEGIASGGADIESLIGMYGKSSKNRPLRVESSMSREGIESILKYGPAEESGLKAAAVRKAMETKAFRDFRNPESGTVEKRKQGLREEIKRQEENIMDVYGKLFEDVKKANPEKYEKLYIKGSEKERQEFAAKILRAAFTGDLGNLEDLQASEPIKKEILKATQTLADSIKNLITDVSYEIQNRRLLDSIMSQAEIDLSQVNVFSSNRGPIDAAKTKMAVDREKMAKEMSSLDDSIREKYLAFFQEVATEVNQSGQMSSADVERILKDANSSISDMQNALALFGRTKEGGNVSWKPQGEDKFKALNREVEQKKVEFNIKKLNEALKMGTDSLKEASEQIQKIRIDTALSDLEKVISDSSLKIKRIDLQKSLMESAMSAQEAFNPSASMKEQNELDRARSNYEFSVAKAQEESQQFYAGIEKDIIQRIGGIKDPYAQNKLLKDVEGVRKGEGGFSNLEKVTELFGRVLEEEQIDQRQQVITNLKVSSAFLLSASKLSSSGDVLKQAAERLASIVNPKTSLFDKISEFASSFSKDGFIGVIKRIFSGKDSSDKKEFKDEELGKLYEELQRKTNILEQKADTSSQRAILANSFAGNEEQRQASIQMSSNELYEKTFSRFRNILDRNLSNSLLIFSNKLKSVSDAMEIFKLKVEGEELDFEMGNVTTPDSIKEYLGGARFEERIANAQKEGQMEMARIGVEQRKSLYDAISRITDVGTRSKIQQEAGGLTNEQLVKVISEALAEEQYSGRDNPFKIAVNDFGTYNEQFSKAVKEFNDKIEEIIEDHGGKNKYNWTSAPQTPSTKSSLPNDFGSIGNFPMKPVEKAQILKGNQGKEFEAAMPIASLSSNLPAKSELPAIIAESLNNGSEAEKSSLKTQNEIKRIQIEQLNYTKRIDKSLLEASILPTEEGRRSAQREADIMRSAPYGKEGVTYESEFDRLSKEKVDAIKSQDASRKETIEREMAALQKELNIRREFKTIGESYSVSIGQLKDDANRLEEEMGRMVISLRDGLVDAFADGISGAKNLGDALQDMVIDLANEVVRSGLKSMFSNIVSGSIGGGGGGLLGFASGGKVVGGSGMRDDVPAMLTGGEYVIRKDSVNKLGVGFLDSINNNGLQGFAVGGLVGQLDAWRKNRYDSAGYQSGMGGYYSPGSYGAGAIVGSQNLRGFASQSFTSGKNDLIRASSDSQGSAGIIALENESWRISQEGRAMDSAYNQVTQSDKEQAFSLALQEEKAREEYEKQKKARKKAFRNSLLSIGAIALGGWATGAIGGINSLPGLLGANSTIGGGLLNFGRFIGTTSEDQEKKIRGTFNKKASGGLITYGTGNRDDVSIGAMGGEYVISKNAVNNVGTPFLDALNNNMVSFSSNNSQRNQNNSGNGQQTSSQEVVDKLDEVISVFEDVGGKLQGNVSVTVNESAKGEASEQYKETGQSSREDSFLARRIKQVVLQTIAEEKRLGGMLSNTK